MASKFDKGVVELLEHLVYSHTFVHADARDNAHRVLDELREDVKQKDNDVKEDDVKDNEVPKEETDVSE